MVTHTTPQSKIKKTEREGKENRGIQEKKKKLPQLLSPQSCEGDVSIFCQQ